MKEQEHTNQPSFSEIETKENLLKQLNFVWFPGGKVMMGARFPVPCNFEGYRHNETPRRELEVGPLWLAKFCITNAQYEELDKKHCRPPTSTRDKDPVTNVTYYDALKFAEFLSQKFGLNFTLPTEPEWVFAAAPYGWELVYKRGPRPIPSKTWTFHPSKPENYHTLEVDNPLDINSAGLYHMGGNVCRIALGSFNTPGHWGAETDGMYCILKGGNFGHCPFGAGVHRRDIMGVAARSERVGFRLAHPDLKVR